MSKKLNGSGDLLAQAMRRVFTEGPIPGLGELVEVEDCDGSRHVASFDRCGIWWNHETRKQLSPIKWRPLS